MTLADKLDEFGKPAWIAADGPGLSSCGGRSVWRSWPSRSGADGWVAGQHGRWQAKMGSMQEKMDRMTSAHGRRGGFGWWRPPTSGNRAFDEYRAETLRRLEEEQREFQEFLDRLRKAKDKAEFDQFMAERRGRERQSAGTARLSKLKQVLCRASVRRKQCGGRFCLAAAPCGKSSRICA